MAADQIHIEPADAPLLAAAGLTDVASVMTAIAGRPTSRHKTRNTAPMALTDGQRTINVYLKRVFRVPAKHIVADLARWRVPQAQPVREWRAIERLGEQGIAVCRAVACGQQRFLGLPRRAFLMVEAVSAPANILITLARLMAAPRTDHAAATHRHTMLAELGAFVRRLHNAGFAYPDLVGKHVYVKPAEARTDAQRWAFILIDVERLGSTTDPKVHQRELAHLLDSLGCLPLGGTDLLRFAIGYLGAPAPRPRRAAVEACFGWAGELLRRVVRQAVRRPRQPDGALRLLEQQFVTAGAVTVNHGFISVLQQNGLGSFRAIFKYADGQRLDKPRLQAWRTRLEINLTDADQSRRRLFLKRYEQPPWREQLRRVVHADGRHSTASWEWRQMQALLRAGIPTMTPVAFGQKMRGWLERRSFVLTEAVPGISLERWVPAELHAPGTAAARRPAAIARRRALIAELARLVAAFHEAGFVHRDLYLAHVFLSTNADGRIALRLIDLARVFRPRWRRTRWIVKDLAALHYSSPSRYVSRTDRVRFLRAYLHARKLGRAGKQLARRVAAKTQRIARHVGTVQPAPAPPSPEVPAAGAPSAP